MDDPFIREHIEGECVRYSQLVQDEASWGKEMFVKCGFFCALSQSSWGTSEHKY